MEVVSSLDPTGIDVSAALLIPHNLLESPTQIVIVGQKSSRDMADIDLYAEYGIPDDMRPAVSSLLDIDARSPLIAAEMRSDAPSVKNLVKEYDAVLPLGISRKYVERRGFDELKALREIVQNALDETEEVSGKPDVSLRQDDLGLWVADEGRGLPVEALSMGASDKRCWMRGYYGEGLKLAAGYFALSGFPVYVFAKGKVYKFVFVPRDSHNPKLHAVLGRSSRRSTGTEVLVQGFRVESATCDRLISFRNKELQGKKIAEVLSESEECPHPKPSTIYDHPNLLYIRNMYVGESSEVAKRKSLFSYDLWWFRLDVSRTLMTYSVPSLFREASKVFEKSPKALRRYAEKLAETGMIRVETGREGTAIRLDPTFGIFEGHLFIYAVPEGLLEAALSVLNMSDKEKLVGLTSSAAEAREGMKRGLLPLIVSEEISNYFKNIPRLQNLMRDS